MLKIGMVVDNRYKILREIGRGGTSCVYLAENIRLHNYWAIKEVYRNEILGDGAESTILTKLRHPGLPSIVDIIGTPQSYLLVMEYVEGVSLDKVLSQKGACSEKDVIKWGQQLCNVLSYLHSQQPAIIYRDMKPANVMLKPDGDIVLIDFGMAREFKFQNQHDTTYLGTHGYAAPEQYNNEQQTDARTDIYSLGVTLYHLVTGHDPCLPPYGINSICSLNPALSKDLDLIIQKCTQLQPEKRYQNVDELNVALKSIGNKVYETTGLNTKLKNVSNKWWLISVPIIVFLCVALVININVDNSNISPTNDTNISQQTESVTEIKKVMVPNIVGLTISEAKNLLSDEGLDIKVSSKKYSNSVKKDFIISQNTEKGSLVEENSTISVIISLGKEKKTVPNLKGLSLKKAESKIKNSGLKCKTKYSYSNSVAKGYVIKQSVASGEKLEVGSTVTITVSKGKKPSENSNNYYVQPTPQPTTKATQGRDSSREDGNSNNALDGFEILD